MDVAAGKTVPEMRRPPLWQMVREGFAAFIDDNALTRGAAIAFYAVTAIAPVLFITTAIAGAVLGTHAASGAVRAQLRQIMTPESANLVQFAIVHAARTHHTVLGSLLDEYVASPFQCAALSEAFNTSHLAHLRQTIADSRQTESASDSLLAGPKAWFAAKAVRMRAEHQLGLSMSPTASASIRLSGRAVVTMIGGRLYTFIDGRRSGSRRLPSLLAADALSA